MHLRSGAGALGALLSLRLLRPLPMPYPASVRWVLLFGVASFLQQTYVLGGRDPCVSKDMVLDFLQQLLEGRTVSALPLWDVTDVSANLFMFVGVQPSNNLAAKLP